MASTIDFTNSSEKVDVKLRQRPKSAVYHKTSSFDNLFGKMEIRRQKPLEATLFTKLQSVPASTRKNCRPLSVCPVTGHTVGANNTELSQLETRRPGEALLRLCRLEVLSKALKRYFEN